MPLLSGLIRKDLLRFPRLGGKAPVLMSCWAAGVSTPPVLRMNKRRATPLAPRRAIREGAGAGGKEGGWVAHAAALVHAQDEGRARL